MARGHVFMDMTIGLCPERAGVSNILLARGFILTACDLRFIHRAFGVFWVLQWG
jgi:hypothetical protein